MESARAACKRLYGFSAWAGDTSAAAGPAAPAVAGPAGVQFFVRGHVPPASLVDGDTRHAELLLEAPSYARCTQAIWRLPAALGHVQVRIDTHEAPSAAQARELLLGLLAQVQVPLEHWQAEDAPGDLAFAAPHGGLVAFVRGNLVVLVTALGRSGLATELSQRFDAGLMARPGVPPLRVRRLDAAGLPPAFKAFVAGSLPATPKRPGQRARVAAADAAPLIDAYALEPVPVGMRCVVVEAHPDP